MPTDEKASKEIGSRCSVEVPQSRTMVGPPRMNLSPSVGGTWQLRLAGSFDATPFAPVVMLAT